MPSLTFERRHGLPALPENFYAALVQRIVVYCGNECETPDFHSAVRTLDQELRLGLRESEQRVLGLMLTALSQASRFGGDINISPALGENSAVHSCHSAILMTELFRRAGLHNGNSAHATSLRLDATLACLVHDMGEILGEFNSIAQRVVDDQLNEEVDIEREIFATALRIATGAEQQRSPDHFYQALRRMRTSAGLTADKGVNAHKELAESLKGFLPTTATTEEEETSVAYFLKLFDLAENCSSQSLSREQRFVGYLVKSIEHIQGVRHFARFSFKEPENPRLALFHKAAAEPTDRTKEVLCLSASGDRVADQLLLPAQLSHSSKVKKTLGYLEGELGHVMSLAQSTEERLLAAGLRDMVYETAVEWLHATAPAHVDRHSGAMSAELKTLNSHVIEATRSFDERREARDALRSAMEAEAAFHEQAHLQELGAMGGVESEETGAVALARVESRERLMGLYLRALQEGYQPSPREILIELDDLPPLLKGFRAVSFTESSPPLHHRGARETIEGAMPRGFRPESPQPPPTTNGVNGH